MGGLLDMLRAMSDGNARLEVEKDGSRCELIGVVDRLRADRLLQFDNSTERHNRSASAVFDVDFGKILRHAAGFFTCFDDNLVLVLRFFYEINVVLGVKVFEGRFEGLDGHTPGLRRVTSH